MARVAGGILGLAMLLGHAAAGWAYDASGDRVFPATLLLPQLAPGDETYVNANTLPLAGGAAGTRSSNVTATYMKTITDNFGISIEETWTAIGQSGAGTAYGWQNLDGELKYLALNDIDHELLFSLGLDRETGGTGALRVGASPSGATTPRAYFGKGLGDLDIGYLRPLAVEGFAGIQLADKAPRPDVTQGGFVLEYSIPYLQSKVQSIDIPDILRNLTPMTEVFFTIPTGRSFGARTTVLIGPGVSYAGEGWELAVEALLPQTRATGTGVGVTAQLHLALDFLFADSVIGKPLFSIR
jgi:hypothetical protein